MIYVVFMSQTAHLNNNEHMKNKIFLVTAPLGDPWPQATAPKEDELELPLIGGLDSRRVFFHAQTP